jgi:Ca2+-binding EF-hand superfamily protein
MMSIISTISSQITSNIFSKLDTTNQGYLNKSEFVSALSQLSSDETSETESDAVFSKIDTDGDGKITKSELSVGVENLLSQLQSSDLQNMKKGAPPSGMEGMPPPPLPPESADSEGVTQEQATEIASSTSDSNLSSLMQTISENFDAADTNQDGKVSQEEAMTYVSNTSSSATSNETASNDTYSEESIVQNMIQELVKAYGFNDSTITASLSASA